MGPINTPLPEPAECQDATGSSTLDPMVPDNGSTAPVSHGNAATVEPPVFDLAAKDTDEAEEDFFPQLARAEA